MKQIIFTALTLYMFSANAQNNPYSAPLPSVSQSIQSVMPQQSAPVIIHSVPNYAPITLPKNNHTIQIRSFENGLYMQNIDMYKASPVRTEIIIGPTISTPLQNNNYNYLKK